MRVLTLNTWGTSGPPERWPVLVESIRRLDADILCLQEVTDTRWSEALDYPARFHAPDSWLAILSRFPANDHRIIRYRAASALEPYLRELLLVRVRLESGPLWVGTTHLAWQEADEPARAAQVKELLEAVAPLKEPVLLSGDFNAAPDHRTMTQIRLAGFLDLFADLHPNDPGITWDNQNRFIQSHSVRFPDRRIDYLLLQEKAARRLVPTTCEVVCNNPTPDGLYPSDHYGVMATFRISS